MYYLLEDNRIIDKNDKKNFDYRIFNGKLQYLRGAYSSNKHKKTQYFYEDVRVKKQSENIYNLIEIGQDLVRVKGNSHNCNENIYRVVDICFLSKLIGFSVLGFALVKTEFDNILAIYKPNKKGDYIKVWEKKENANN